MPKTPSAKKKGARKPRTGVARRPKAKKSGPIVRLTARQTELLATADQAVELRDHAGTMIGYLVVKPEITRFFSAAEMAELRRRAADKTPGRTLKEIMREVEERMKSLHASPAAEARAGA